MRTILTILMVCLASGSTLADTDPCSDPLLDTWLGGEVIASGISLKIGVGSETEFRYKER